MIISPLDKTSGFLIYYGCCTKRKEYDMNVYTVVHFEGGCVVSAKSFKTKKSVKKFLMKKLDDIDMVSEIIDNRYLNDGAGNEVHLIESRISE